MILAPTEASKSLSLSPHRLHFISPLQAPCALTVPQVLQITTFIPASLSFSGHLPLLASPSLLLPGTCTHTPPPAGFHEGSQSYLSG